MVASKYTKYIIQSRKNPNILFSVDGEGVKIIDCTNNNLKIISILILKNAK